MGELYAYVMREAHGNVWITGPDFEKPVHGGALNQREMAPARRTSTSPFARTRVTVEGTPPGETPSSIT